MTARAPPTQSALLLVALVLCADCNRTAPGRGSGGASPESTLAPAPAATTATPPAAPGQTPLAAPGQTPLAAPESVIGVPLAGFLPAVATIPVGSSGPRPVAIAVHGMSDGPQWACPLWRGVLGGGVFILCPRGVKEHDQPPGVTPGTTYYTFTTWEALDAEIDAGLAALRESFPGRVDDGPTLYIGFSLGARFGISIALAHPGRYPRLVLSEGGHDDWTSVSARRFAENGGARVLFGCGDLACVAEAKPKVPILEGAGIQVKLVHGAGSGHQPYGPLFDETRKVIDWREGDPHWVNR